MVTILSPHSSLSQLRVGTTGVGTAEDAVIVVCCLTTVAIARDM